MTYVYIITRNGREFPCKVGIAERPEKRLASLQSGSPDKLALREVYWFADRSAALDMERQFQDAYADDRMNSEWFGIEFEDANFWLFENTASYEEIYGTPEN